MIDQDRHIMTFSDQVTHTAILSRRKRRGMYPEWNQNLEQLREFRTFTGMHEQRLINAILGNVGNLIVFNIGVIDATILSPQFDLSVHELMMIGRYEAAAKLVVDGFETQPFTLCTEEAVMRNNSSNLDRIMALRNSYYVNSKDILSEIPERVKNLVITSAPKLPWLPGPSLLGDEHPSEPALEPYQKQENKNIEITGSMIVIKDCPKCHGTHKYSFEVQRSPILGHTAEPRKKRYFKRIFTCPAQNVNFEARFSLNLEESASIRLAGILFKA